MNGEVLETTKSTDWTTKVKGMAPLAVSLLIISVTYLFVGVNQRDRTSLAVAVCAGAALLFLPAIAYVFRWLRATDFKVLKSWLILFPVMGWLIGEFLLVPWIGPWIRGIF